MQITALTGTDLAALVRTLNERSKAGKLHTLRIHQRPDGVMYKVNEGEWTPVLGSDGRS